MLFSPKITSAAASSATARLSAVSVGRSRARLRRVIYVPANGNATVVVSVVLRRRAVTSIAATRIAPTGTTVVHTDIAATIAANALTGIE